MAASPGVTVSWDGCPTVIEVATVVRPIYAVVVDGSEYEWEPWGVSSVALHRHTSMRQWAAAALSLHYLIDGGNDLPAVWAHAAALNNSLDGVSDDIVEDADLLVALSSQPTGPIHLEKTLARIGGPEKLRKLRLSLFRDHIAERS